MFDPIKEVPDVDMCKKLRDLGYPQTGDGWYWAKVKITREFWVFGKKYKEDIYDIRGKLLWPANCILEYVKAPTRKELEEWASEANSSEDREALKEALKLAGL